MSTTNPAAPPRTPTLAGKLLALAGVLVASAYLANIGAGLAWELPDFVPGVGNLDEVFFSGLLIVCLHQLGINIIPGLAGPKYVPPRIGGPGDVA